MVDVAVERATSSPSTASGVDGPGPATSAPATSPCRPGYRQEVIPVNPLRSGLNRLDGRKVDDRVAVRRHRAIKISSYVLSATGRVWDNLPSVPLVETVQSGPVPSNQDSRCPGGCGSGVDPVVVRFRGGVDSRVGVSIVECECRERWGSGSGCGLYAVWGFCVDVRIAGVVEPDPSSNTCQESDDPDSRFTLVTLPVCDLLRSESPRTAGESEEHAKLLAESHGELPPILVHRETMTVIDGAHRLRAAELRGERMIRAQLFDGSEIDAFVLAVEANTTHGLPLSRADRLAAATRIIESRPQWSDRAVARVAGISARTVGVIRRRASADRAQLPARVGRDGRTRPLSTAAGRRIAADLLRSNPGDSLRRIAAAAGISTGTVRDVRDRIDRGEDPVPPKSRRAEEHAVEVIAPRVGDSLSIARNLRMDPALRFSETGRSLIRLLDAHVPILEDRERLATNVPPHAAGMVAELARGYAEIWQRFAREVERGGR